MTSKYHEVPEYVIIVPSRKREHNMPTIMELLPTAYVTVDEREIENYRPYVPEDRLIPHPPMKAGLFAVYNWMMRQWDEPVMIEIDDDFRGIKCNVGSRRFITEPDEILAILENAIVACTDLGVTAFGFSRTPNTSVIHPEDRPIVPVQSICGCFGVMGNARYRPYDTKYLGRGDVDWTLRTLLEDRVVYADLRFFFDCGGAFAGRGGNVGIVTPEDFERTSRLLKEKWGKHAKFKAPAYVKSRQVAPISLDMSRTNRSAQK